MAKYKVYVEESFVHEIEIECNNENDIEDIIKSRYANITVTQEHTPNNVQYMVEYEDSYTSSWTELY